MSRPRHGRQHTTANALANGSTHRRRTQLNPGALCLLCGPPAAASARRVPGPATLFDSFFFLFQSLISIIFGSHLGRDPPSLKIIHLFHIQKCSKTFQSSKMFKHVQKKSCGPSYCFQGCQPGCAVVQKLLSTAIDNNFWTTLS